MDPHQGLDLPVQANEGGPILPQRGHLLGRHLLGNQPLVFRAQSSELGILRAQRFRFFAQQGAGPALPAQAGRHSEDEERETKQRPRRAAHT